jgi:hypothetical protein
MLTVLLSATFACASLSAVVGVGGAKARGLDSNSRGRIESDERSTRPLMPAHTFSIVARDPATGEMGVAVQSHWFSVGSNVAWAEAGVGAVATQSFIDPSYGRNGLDLMRGGGRTGKR